MKVTVLGTGIMGAGMARSLRRAGHEVAVWNRTAARAAPLADEGVTVAGTVAEAVAGADAVVTMLFDLDATLAVSEELVGALGPRGGVWILSATVGPDGARRVEAAAAATALLDAPMLGTRKPAEDGTLTALVAGAADVIDRVHPVFDAVAARTVVVGTRVGAASALKLACNAWIGLITAGTAQSLAFAEQLGVDPALFLTAISGGPVDSPYAQAKGAAMLAGDYTTSFAVDGVVKDLGLMLDAAAASDFPAELLAAVRAQFERASAAGHGAQDMAAVRSAFPPP